MIVLPTLIIIATALWPNPTVNGGTPRWVRYGRIVVGVILSQPHKRRFLNLCYRNGKVPSPALGINWHLGNITAAHATELRQLLLTSGDVESNPGPVSCDICGKIFASNSAKNQHVKIVHGSKDLMCDQCIYATDKPSSLKRHKQTHIAGPSTPSREMRACDQCPYASDKLHNFKRHMNTHKKEPPRKRQRREEDIEAVVKKTINRLVNKVATKEETALGRRLRVITEDATGNDPEMYLNDMIATVKGHVDEELESKTGIKVQLRLAIQFFKPTKPDKPFVGGFWSRQMSVYRGSDYDASEMFPKILQSIDEFMKEGSGSVIDHLVKLEIHMAECKPFHGSSYRQLPEKLRGKGAIINIQNKDEQCFLWSVLAQLYPVDSKGHANRVSKYQANKDKLDMVGIDFPVRLHQIARFEKQNNLAVNVYGFEEDELFPLRISVITGKPWVHLLLYDGHYSLIRNLGRLLGDLNKHNGHIFFCPRCLIHRSSQELLDEHSRLCIKKDPTRVTVPEEKKLKFSNIHKMLRHPLVVYADMECLTEKIDGCAPDPETSHTHVYQKHTPCGYGLVVSRGCDCKPPEFENLEFERNARVVEQFLLSVVSIANEHHKRMKKPEPMTGLDKQKHTSNKCHVCGKEIKQGEKKVKDHCHICGKYRGPAHNQCNQGYRLNRDVVVVFHNLRRYDGHLLMEKIGSISKLQGFEIQVIARTMEDYISFSLKHKKENDGKGGAKDFTYQIRFIDSVQFLNNSLEGLVSNMAQDKFNAVRKWFPNEEEREMLLRKGVYPYDYMDNWCRFEEGLPPKEAFYSCLNDEIISDADYCHAQKVWQMFNIPHMGKYHDLYLQTDVLLLADVFEEFRRFSLEKYGLDPCHYVTTPSLAWDACLKMTKVELDLLPDEDMYLFCESGIRGGISQISHRFAKANNPYLNNYDSEEPNSYIMYLDANNLYGWAMVQKMPVGEFRWMTDAEKAQDWKMFEDGDIGYILDVDLDYPEELHDSHNDYPLAPETIEIVGISPYCERLKEILDLNTPPQTKLVPNLNNKMRYILHHRNLKLYLQLGLKLANVHRGLRFQQAAWMDSYIMFNTSMRAKATNAFDKDLLKLFNNAVFGKTMENVRKYKNIELVTLGTRFEKLVANPRYRYSSRFNENLVGVCSLRPSTSLCKPIYCGLTVLDLSKELMYRFHYEYIVPKYGQQARLLFTDTDSLCYHVQTDDIYKDMQQDEDRFDFSDYPKSHFLQSDVNKKVIGKMKDETNGDPIDEFCGLRSKMYSIWSPNIAKKRAKGIKKSVVKRAIFHKDYKDTLFGETHMHHKMNVIRSHLHQMFTETINKKSLSAYDDKRWLLDAINSRAHGHYSNKYAN